MYFGQSRSNCFANGLWDYSVKLSTFKVAILIYTARQQKKRRVKKFIKLYAKVFEKLLQIGNYHVQVLSTCQSTKAHWVLSRGEYEVCF